MAGVQARAGMVEAARQTAAAVHDGSRRSEALREVAVAQASRHDATAAVLTVGAIPNPAVRQATLMGVLNALVRAGDVPAAIRVATHGRSESDAARLLLEVAAVQRGFGDLPGASQTAALIQHPRQQDDWRTGLTGWLTDRGDLAEAERVARTIQDPASRDAALVGVAAARAAAGDDRALAALPSPEVRDGALLQRAMFRAEQGRFPEALAAAGQIGWSHVRSMAQMVVAGGQARAGNLGGALQTIQAMEPAARPGGLQVVADGRAQAGDVAGAIALADTPGFETARDHILRRVAESRAAAGDLTGAEQASAAIRDRERREDAAWAVAVARGRSGDAAALLAVIDRTPPGRPRVGPERLRALLSALDGLLDERLFPPRPLSALGPGN